MKGLLLKDLYMMKKHCKAYVFIVAVFMAASFSGQENLFFIFYPCLLCGMIPVNLLSYDEVSRWLQYCGALPYTKGQIVSGKYIVGMMVQGAVLILTGVTQAVRMHLAGGFQPGEFAALMLMVLIMALVTSSVGLPFMFRWGVAKGRIVYLVTIGAVCAGSVIVPSLYRGGMEQGVPLLHVLPLIAVIGAGLYALSWYLSVVFFRRREVC